MAIPKRQYRNNKNVSVPQRFQALEEIFKISGISSAMRSNTFDILGVNVFQYLSFKVILSC